MDVIGLLCVIGMLLLFIGWLEWLHIRERRTLINTIISRSPAEARMLNQDLDRNPFREPPERRIIPTDPEMDEFWKHGEPVGL